MNLLTEKLNECYILEKINFNDDFIEIDKILQEGFISDNIDKLKNSYEKNMKTVNTFLVDHGVNLKRLKRKAINLKNEIKGDFHNRVDPKTLTKKISYKISKIVIDEGKQLKDTIENEYSLGEKIFGSILIFICVFISSSLILSISAPILGNLAMIVTSIIVAPIIEEAGKRIAVLEKYPWVYTGIFAGIEMLMYVFDLINAGGAITAVIIMRLMALMMHFGTAIIQKYFHDKSISENDDSYSYAGYILAVFVHATWNIIGVLFNKQISSIVGL